MLKRIVKSQKNHSTTMSARAAVNKYNPIWLFHIFFISYSQSVSRLSTETGEFWTTFMYLFAQGIEIALRISGIAVVSSIAIPETVSLSSLQFQVSHNTNLHHNITASPHCNSLLARWRHWQQQHGVGSHSMSTFLFILSTLGLNEILEWYFAWHLTNHHHRHLFYVLSIK